MLDQESIRAQCSALMASIRINSRIIGKNSMDVLKLITIVITVVSVIGLVAVGIFIGKTFGTFEKFVLEMLEMLKEKVKRDE